MARLFDATNPDLIEWSSYPAIKLQGGFTISCWIRLDSDTSDDQRIMDTRQADTTFVAQLQVTSLKALQFVHTATAGIPTIRSDDSLIKLDGTLQHVAATSDGGVLGDNYVVYIDGLDVSFVSDNGTGSLIEGGTNIVIGVRPLVPDRGVDGLIAEVALWETEQNPSIITSLAKGYSPLCFPKNLVFYAPMIRGLQSITGGTAGSPTGTTVTTHPRIIYPTKSPTIVVPTSSITYSFPPIVGNCAIVGNRGLGIIKA